MTTLWLDFETRSRCDLTQAGAYNYAQDPSTEVLCMSYAFDDEEVTTWLPGQPFPERVAQHREQIRAHNAAFERLIFWYVLCPDHGFPEPRLEQFYCTAAQARANCGPGSLEDVGRFAGASMKKDHRGAQLIRALSIPKPDGTFREDAALMREMVEYCETDVRAMRAVSKAMRELSAEELADYHVNERINDRGVLVDVALCNAAIRYAEQELVEIEQTVREVTEGAITSVRSPKMRAWVEHRVGPQARKLMTVYKDGEAKVSIDKTVRGNLLSLADENPDEVPPDVAEVIQCADDLWASSVAKFARAAALADAEDGRVRGAFVFSGGAATGRACVSAQTLVESEHGRRPISALAIGVKVLTHTGRFCKVTRVIYKGRQTMYRVVAASGGWVDCTEDHLLLTDKGWRSVKELIRHTKSRNTADGDGFIHVATVPYDGGSWPHDRPNPRNCLGDRAGDRTARAITHPQSGELLEIEDGRQEPYVWCAETSRSYLARRIPLSLDGRRHISAGASACVDARLWADAMAGGLGSASHRRQQDEQRTGQLSGGDKSRASKDTFSEIRKIVCVGEKGVWDISVEGDASYVAQGLIHHNSSYGLQVHNFPRKCAEAPDDVRQAMVRGHQVVPAYGRRVTDVLKGMLRPALLPAPGNVLIAADWSAIEARVNPWLSKTNSGAEKLGIFERGEDVYKVNASATFRVAVEDVTKEQRQVGKVQELACGFAGGVGAFAAMGRIYGVNLPESETKRMVDAWRRANSWAVPFWQGLEDAYTRAMRNRGHEFSAGRITYLFDGQHLWYALPSGRVLCYPFARLEPEGVTYAKASWKPAADAKEWPRARLWRGLACIAENTPVLTERGWVPIQSVSRLDRVWDGEEWVTHDGVAFQGVGRVIKAHGVSMTPDHLVLTTEGWVRADESEGRNRAPCREPDRRSANWLRRAALRLADTLRLRRNPDHEVAELHEAGSRGAASVVRVPQKGFHARGAQDARHDPTPGLRGVAVNERPLQIADAPSLVELRWSGHHGMRGLANVFRSVLARHGADVSSRADAGPHEQRGALQSGELPLGVFQGAGAKHTPHRSSEYAARAHDDIGTGRADGCRGDDADVSCAAGRDGRGVAGEAEPVAEVFDLVNCGPRRRFVVRDEWGGMLIVHNCENVTQACAHDLLRHSLRQLEAEGHGVVLHVHDEIVVETPDPDAAKAAMQRIMCSPPAWAAGIPLDIEASVMNRYGK